MILKYARHAAKRYYTVFRPRTVTRIGRLARQNWSMHANKDP